MSWKLFLDDERFPVSEDFIIARNYDEAVNLIEKNGIPIFISFDHDLGKSKTGYDFCKYLIDYCIDNNVKMCEYYVHSQNPVGRENIIKYIENFNAL